MSETNRDAISTFLRDYEQTQLQFKDGQWHKRLIRCPYDSETDFLYLTRAYMDNGSLAREHDAEYVGIYSRLKDTVYDVRYNLSEIVGDCEVVRESCVVEAISKRASEIAMEIVDGKQVEVTTEAVEPHEDREYFMAYTLRREAEKHFFARTMPTLNFTVSIRDLPTTEFVQAINHPEELAREKAEAYVRKYAKHINNTLWQIPLLRQEVEKLEASANDLHMRRRIAECIGDEKMVRLEIERDGYSMTTKYEAKMLKRTDCDSYYNCYMDANSRAEFRRLFGRTADLMPGDIVRILYGRKVLYEKEQ